MRKRTYELMVSHLDEKVDSVDKLSFEVHGLEMGELLPGFFLTCTTNLQFNMIAALNRVRIAVTVRS